MMHNQPVRILIVDNDEGMVAAISARLEHEGFECETASSGSQGFIAATEQDFDLIISDLNMPMGDGIAFAKRVREHSEVPIIFVTGFEREYCAELEELSYISIVGKPFHPGQLLEIIDVELALSNARPIEDL